MNLRVHVEPLRGPALIRDYYNGAAALAPFFPGSPWDPNAWRRVAADVRAYFDSDKLNAMQGAIRAATPAAQAKLERIVRGDGFFVQTGQQAGLFGGPLYTVHKILTAVRVAQEAEKLLGVPVAPLFWIAADDHDFAEVNHAYLLSEDNTLHKLQLSDDGRPPASMQRRLLGSEIETVVAELRELLPDTQSARELARLLVNAYTPANNVADAFGALIHFLFDRFDVMVTSSSNATLKQLSVPLVEHELRNAEQHEDAVNGQTQKLVSRGYHEQVPVRSDAANVSYEDENGRDRLMRLGTDWELSRSKQRFSNQEITEVLRKEPQRFSANVLLRPVVASAVFPTLAYVGGPAEISYFAQIGCLFAAHGVPMPIVAPRATLEIVEYKVQKVLDKFRLQNSDVHKPFHELSTRIVRDQLPAGVTDSIEELRKHVFDGYAKLVDSAITIDPTLRGPLESARNKTDKLLSDMDRKVVRHLKKKNSIELEQLRRASVNLYPEGQPQERVLGIITYYARYGGEVLDAIAEEIQFKFDWPHPDWNGVICG